MVKKETQDFITKTLEEFREEFNEDTVFGSDNFEDPKHINHPCYSHYGVIAEFESFLKQSLKQATQEEKLPSKSNDSAVSTQEEACNVCDHIHVEVCQCDCPAVRIPEAQEREGEKE